MHTARGYSVLHPAGGDPSSSPLCSSQHPDIGAPTSAPQTSQVLQQLRGQEEAQEGAVKGYRSPLLAALPGHPGCHHTTLRTASHTRYDCSPFSKWPGMPQYSDRIKSMDTQ